MDIETYRKFREFTKGGKSDNELVVNRILADKNWKKDPLSILLLMQTKGGYGRREYEDICQGDELIPCALLIKGLKNASDPVIKEVINEWKRLDYVDWTSELMFKFIKNNESK